MLNPSWLKASTALETSILGVLSSGNSGVGGGGWTPQPGDYLLNETGLFLTDEFGNQLTA